MPRALLTRRNRLGLCMNTACVGDHHLINRRLPKIAGREPKVLADTGARRLTCRPKVKCCGRRSSDEAEGTGGRRCPEVDLPTEDSSNATEGLRMMPKDREAQRSPRSSDGLRMMPKDCESRRSPRSSGGLRMMLKVRRFSKNQEGT